MVADAPHAEQQPRRGVAEQRLRERGPGEGNAARPVSASKLCLCKSWPGGLAARMLLVRASIC
jgi:hypothetical protein